MFWAVYLFEELLGAWVLEDRFTDFGAAAVAAANYWRAWDYKTRIVHLPTTVVIFEYPTYLEA